MSEYNTLESVITEDGKLLQQVGFIVKHNQDKEWVQQVKATFGSTLSQQIYNYWKGIKVNPKCPQCGENLIYKSFSVGYKCKNCRNVKEKETNNFNQKINIDKDNIDKTFVKKLNQEEDKSKNLVRSEVLVATPPSSNEELLKLHGLDPAKWVLTKTKHSIWNSFSNKMGVIDLYASKIEAAPKTLENMSVNEFFEKIKTFTDYKPQLIKPIPTNKELTLIFPIADFHYGLRSNVDINSYNMDEAEKRLMNCVGKQIAALEPIKHKVTNIIITLGNDYFNADTLDGTTTKGTRQDQEDDYFNIVERGTKLAIQVIETFNKHFKANIEVYNVASNHDRVTSSHMVWSLYYNFKNSSQITIYPESSKNPRIYKKIGNTLVGFTHQLDPKNALNIMSFEAQEDWSKTQDKIFLAAHIHHERAMSYGNLVVKTLPIISGASNWSNEQGYTASTPRMQTFLIDNTEGLINTFNLKAL